MVNIFTAGLREKIKKNKGQPPRELVEVIRDLRNFPSSVALCRSAIRLAKRVLGEQVCPIPLITKRVVVVFGYGTGKEVAVEYERERTLKTEDGRSFCDHYSFHAFGEEEDEICISREGGFRYPDENELDELSLLPEFSMRPVCLEFIKGDSVRASYSY
jgi:hypothetical protein